MTEKLNTPNCFRRTVVWVSIISFLTNSASLYGQVVAAPNGGQYKPTVDTAANGVPVVQITAPSAAGVSRNQYQQFNVDPQGLILNNSQGMVQTQQAGWIAGNPNLGGGSARIILNEVTSTNPSSLRGFTEVAGSAAEVVIANPNGITCNGCGFINTPRAVLTTGTPVFGGSGSLDAYRVTSGTLTIEGSGLNASGIDRVDLIARAVQANASIWAKELNVVAGANQVNHADLGYQVITGTGGQPAIGIDVAALGGMYAGKITLVGTEAGVGVRQQGSIASSAGDFTLTSAGDVILSGVNSASGNIVVSSNENIQVTGSVYASGTASLQAIKDLSNSGTIGAQGDVSLGGRQVSLGGVTAAGANTSGFLVGNSKLTITASQSIVGAGKLFSSGDLSATGPFVSLGSATISAGGDALFQATNGDLTLTNSQVIANGRINLLATESVVTDSATVQAGSNFLLSAKNVSNVQGRLSALAGDVSITASNAADNTGGTVSSNQNIVVTASSFTNTQGTVSAGGNISMTTDTLDNTLGTLSSTGEQTIQARSNLINTRGNIESGSGMSITAGSFAGTYGRIVSAGGSLSLLVTGLMDIQNALVGSNSSVSLSAGSMNATAAQISAGDALSLTTSGLLSTNSASVLSNALLSINAGSYSNRGGVLQGAGTSITAGSLDNTNGKILGVGSSAVQLLVTNTLDNTSGQIGGGGLVDITANSIINSLGTIAGGDSVTLSATTGLNNQQGLIYSGSDVTINQSNADLTNVSGQIGAARDIFVRALNIQNDNGKINAGRDVSLQITGISGSGGQSIAGNDLSITSAASLTNGTGQKLQANRNAMVRAQSFTNSGSFQAVQNASINATTLSLGSTSLLQGNVITLAATDVTNQGGINGNQVNITANSMNNSGAVMGDTVKIVATDITNDGAAAVIAATQKVELYASNSFANKNGATVYSLGDIAIAGSASRNAQNQLDNPTTQVLNESSSIEAEGNIEITAAQITNKKTQFVFGTTRVWLTSIHDKSYFYGLDFGHPEYWSGFNWTWGAPYMGDYNNSRTLWVEYKDVTGASVDSPSAKISASGDIVLRGNVDNQYSLISAGGTLSAVGGTVTNTGASYYEKIVKDGFYGYKRKKCDNEYIGACIDAYQYYEEITKSAGGAPAVMAGNQSVSIHATTINNGNVTEVGGPVGSIATTLTPNTGASTLARTNSPTPLTGNPLPSGFTLPQSGLFKVVTDPGRQYLVETDPRFATRAGFISSDYLLQRLGYDPTTAEKRLGDSFYEAQLVRDQLLQLTGRRNIDGASSYNQWYQALLDNGVALAQDLNLKPGLALSKEQVGALQKNLVWLEEREVAGQKVLVPVLYLANQSEMELQPTGALIASKDVNIQVADTITSGGKIQASNVLTMQANNVVVRGGELVGTKQVNILASQDIVNQSGVIRGGEVALTAGQDIVMETLSSVIQLDGVKLDRREQTASVESSQNLTLSATRDIRLVGANASSDGNITASAGDKVTLTASSQRNQVSTEHMSSSSIDNQGSSLDAKGNVSITTTGSAEILGSSIASGGKTAIVATDGITIGAVKDERSYSNSYVGHNEGSSYASNSSGSTQTVVGSNISGDTGVQGVSGQDIKVEASRISSDKGNIALVASRNIDIVEATETTQNNVDAHQNKSGFLSKSSTDTTSKLNSTLSVGSMISGDSVDITAGNNLSVRGSSVVGTNDTNLSAVGDVRVTAAVNQYAQQQDIRTKASGLFVADSGFGITLGSRSAKDQLNGQQTEAVSSTVGSVVGNVNIQSNSGVTVQGSNVLAGNDINIVAPKIDITAAENTQTNIENHERKQSGLTLGVSNPIVTAVQTVQQMANAASQTSDPRMQALAAASSALAVKNAYDAVKAGQALKDGNLADQAGGINVSISLGSSKSQSESSQSSSTAVGSSLSAGNNLALTATAGDLTVIGSTLSAGNNALLNATDKINLLAAANTSSNQSDSSGSSAGLGVGFSLGAKTGFYVTASASQNKGNSNGSDTTYTNTTVQAGNTASLSSGNDTTLKGAAVTAKQVVADVGGNLNIETLQDTSTYKENSSSSGFSINVPIVGNAWGGSLSAGQTKIDSDYRSANQQSGIQAGDNGFQVNVQGNTDLKGAVIASTDKAVIDNKNSFSTGGSLALSDLQNQASYQGTAIGVNIGAGTSLDGTLMPQGTSAGFGQESGSASSTTQSGISAIAGNQAVRSGDSANGIQQIFDAAKVQQEINAQVAITQQFGQLASKAVGDYAEGKVKEATALRGQSAALKDSDPTQAAALEAQAKALEDQWGDKGTLRIAAHTLIGGLTGGVDGAVGATVGTITAPLVSDALNKAGIDGTLAKTLTALASTAAGATVGGTAGASTALNEVANNYLNHQQMANVLARLKQCRAENNCGQIAEQLKKDITAWNKTNDAELAACYTPDCIADNMAQIKDANTLLKDVQIAALQSGTGPGIRLQILDTQASQQAFAQAGQNVVEYQKFQLWKTQYCASGSDMACVNTYIAGNQKAATTGALMLASLVPASLVARGVYVSATELIAACQVSPTLCVNTLGTLAADTLAADALGGTAVSVSAASRIAKLQAQVTQEVADATRTAQVLADIKTTAQPVAKVEDLFGKTFPSIPVSNISTLAYQDGKLAEQMGLQLANEYTGLNLRPLQNGSNHGCDGCDVAIKDNVIWVADVKSSQNGLANAATAEGDPAVKLTEWLKKEWATSPANQELANQLKKAIADGAQIKGITIQVGIPAPGKSGTADFRVLPWTK